MNENEAQAFAARWIDDWNRHDAQMLLSHYAENVEYASPFVATLAKEPSGILRGRAALERYIAAGLAAYPDLHFELRQVFVGVQSVVLHYRSVNDLLAAETLIFDNQGKICRVLAHYTR